MEALCHVSLKAITQNYTYFLKRVNPARVIPVVKANAYGHGAVRVTRHLRDTAGVQIFAVATLEEAIELANQVSGISILIFSRVFSSELPRVPANAILSVGSMEDAEALNDASRTTLAVHLNVNTGMNRLGVTPEQALELVDRKLSKLSILGVYSHFSSSDTRSQEVYKAQNNVFLGLVEKLRGRGFSGMIHLANSAAGLHGDQRSFDAMRLGIGLYGYDTTPDQAQQASLTPAMTVKAPLIRVARIEAGESVSYAERWQAAVATNIGTLRIGYADGYNRGLTNRGMVAHCGKTYPVIGTVTMDHIMVDLGEDSPPTGSLFEVLGGDTKQVGIQHISWLLNTIPYEVCCAVSDRVRRDYSDPSSIKTD